MATHGASLQTPGRLAPAGPGGRGFHDAFLPDPLEAGPAGAPLAGVGDARASEQGSPRWAPPAGSATLRADLHCHSIASTEADEAVLSAIKCPECFSEPADVFGQATRRGMDFVTITDHDSIEGVKRILDRPNVIVGEEVTCYFPEDRCKMHILVWGITAADHDALQARAADVYQVAEYIEQNRIAHAVAHPVYRQNDVLDTWHLERLLLIFKGFESLNGAHSLLHRDALEPMLDEVTRSRIESLSQKHSLAPRWPEPWKKTRTGGSDDHGLFNIGRTWTEFPAEARTVADVLDCLRDGRCRPGGEAGSSLKLAHNFYGVGIRYFSRQMLPAGAKPTIGTALLQMLVGERRTPRKRDIARMAVGQAYRVAGRKLRSAGRTAGRVIRPLTGRRKAAAPEATRNAAHSVVGRPGTALLMDLFIDSFAARSGDFKPLTEAMGRGDAPLGEHDAVFKLINLMNRDICGGIVGAIEGAAGAGELASMFDVLSAVAAHQFTLLPYYFALFHQNRERHLLPRITGHGRTVSATTLRVAVFTDRFDEPGEVSRFVQAIGAASYGRGKSLTVHTCTANPRLDVPWRKNFVPLVNKPVAAEYGGSLVIPPIAEVLEWADRQQFDAVHIDTAGPMGLCGWMVAKMLRVPLLSTHHVDLSSLVYGLTADWRLTSSAHGLAGWLRSQSAATFVRSRAGKASAVAAGAAAEKLAMLPPGVDESRFHPGLKRADFWSSIGVAEKFRLLYIAPPGRPANLQNLGLLSLALARVVAGRCDVALVIVGEPWVADAVRNEAPRLPIYVRSGAIENDEELAVLMANADLLLDPSRVDLCGQRVVEAQACGLPVLVGDAGATSEVMDDGISGRVLPAGGASASVSVTAAAASGPTSVGPKDLLAWARAWADAIDELLNDEATRLRMARSAPHRVARFARVDGFELFWEEHVKAARAERERDDFGRACPVSPAPAGFGDGPVDGWPAPSTPAASGGGEAAVSQAMEAMSR